MKTFVSLLLCAIIGMVASNPMLASMDGAMELALFTHKKYVNATCRKSSRKRKIHVNLKTLYLFFHSAPTPDCCDQGVTGCCPYIVRPGPKGSVIQPFTGYRGNAAIIVDWGSPWNRDCSYRRNCTVTDVGFV